MILLITDDPDPEQRVAARIIPPGTHATFSVHSGVAPVVTILVGNPGPGPLYIVEAERLAAPWWPPGISK